tara:strand:- start:828 stop:1235 length:408 start_codon:yes stop_codon:yes gene_type:complete
MKQQVNQLDQLDQFTKQLAPQLKPGSIYCLNGSMGAGKTTFVASVMKQFNFYDVSSPSFTLVNVYESTPPVYHIDLYRLENQMSINNLDLDYYFSSTEHIIFVEWASRLHDFSWEYYTIDIQRLEQDKREISCLF